MYCKRNFFLFSTKDNSQISGTFDINIGSNILLNIPCLGCNFSSE